mgnify:CR=1 FL=1
MRMDTREKQVKKAYLTGRKRSEETRAKMSASHMGVRNSPETKAKISASLTGRKQTPEHRATKVGSANPNWVGGIRDVAGGKYLEALARDHPHSNKSGYVRIHRLVLEQAIGRYLEPEEVVHHIDGNSRNNAIENLMLFASNGEHSKYHNDIRRIRSEGDDDHADH